MTPPLETLRLILRAPELADAAQTQALFPHWEIVRFLNNKVPWPYPADGAYTFFRDVALPAIERGDSWHWTLRLKTAPEQLIGHISLSKGEKNRGFWIGLPWQGQGLMMEAADAVTDYWFEVLKFPLLRVPKAVFQRSKACVWLPPWIVISFPDVSRRRSGRSRQKNGAHTSGK
jgi:RimJ/RimL family protein N-acetyltransferase